MTLGELRLYLAAEIERGERLEADPSYRSDYSLGELRGQIQSLRVIAEKIAP